ncbi:hypothetical protein HAZT_HAZT006597 [Hyalella azteca]|uniref:Lysophospholipid acyltransferase 5 n=1 Tax=Hyalella azteca TaxID=294128 RepID=A0A6A0H352_HYAAZ|nr:hypothetical protein HAZT_HAZT006597 [Hyalella azteca]
MFILFYCEKACINVSLMFLLSNYLMMKYFYRLPIAACAPPPAVQEKPHFTTSVFHHLWHVNWNIQQWNGDLSLDDLCVCLLAWACGWRWLTDVSYLCQHLPDGVPSCGLLHDSNHIIRHQVDNATLCADPAPHCTHLGPLRWNKGQDIDYQSLLSAEQAQTALSECPSLLEVAAHTYFPASYMVGPQFNMKRYLDFTHGRLFSSYLPNSLLAGFTRGALGLFFMAVFQVSSVWLKEDYLVSDEFAELSLLKKAVYVALWGKVTLYKYNSCWLIVEGVCIISGLSYNGRDSSSGLERWDACKNIKVTLFEKAFKFYHIIESFNVNTNVWVAK